MTTESLVAVFFALLGLALWMVPSMIAFSRKHPKRMEILLVDIFLTWTVLGWFFALGWALRGWEAPIAEAPAEEVKAKASAA